MPLTLVALSNGFCKIIREQHPPPLTAEIAKSKTALKVISRPGKIGSIRPLDSDNRKEAICPPQHEQLREFCFCLFGGFLIQRQEKAAPLINDKVLGRTRCAAFLLLLERRIVIFQALQTVCVTVISGFVRKIAKVELLEIKQPDFRVWLESCNFCKQDF